MLGRCFSKAGCLKGRGEQSQGRDGRTEERLDLKLLLGTTTTAAITLDQGPHMQSQGPGKPGRLFQFTWEKNAKKTSPGSWAPDYSAGLPQLPEGRARCAPARQWGLLSHSVPEERGGSGPGPKRRPSPSAPPRGGWPATRKLGVPARQAPRVRRVPSGCGDARGRCDTLPRLTPTQESSPRRSRGGARGPQSRPGDVPAPPTRPPGNARAQTPQSGKVTFPREAPGPPGMCWP